MRTLSLLALPIVLVIAAGCVSPWKREYLPDLSGDGVFLYREHEEVDGKRQPRDYAHPADVSIEKLEAVLSRIVYVRDPLFRSPKNTLVFTPAEVDKLAEPLADGLQMLKPDERVRFLVTRSGGVFSMGPNGVSGVVFQTRDGLLNVAFDAIDQGINQGDDGRPEEVAFPYNPTEMTGEDPLVPMEGGRLYRDAAGQTYPRWLTIDLAAVEEPAPVATAPPAGLGRPAEVPPPAVAPPGTTTEEETRYGELRKKIETLNRLRADGVITEEQYRERFDEIMKDL